MVVLLVLGFVLVQEKFEIDKDITDIINHLCVKGAVFCVTIQKISTHDLWIQFIEVKHLAFIQVKY